MSTYVEDVENKADNKGVYFVEHGALTPDRELSPDSHFSATEQKRIMRKLDLRIVTITGLIYCISQCQIPDLIMTSS